MFPNLAGSRIALLKANLIMLEPCDVVSKSLPQCDIIRPTLEQCGGRRACQRAHSGGTLRGEQSAEF